jgi:hypothetical protein
MLLNSRNIDRMLTSFYNKGVELNQRFSTGMIFVLLPKEDFAISREIFIATAGTRYATGT